MRKKILVRFRLGTHQALPNGRATARLLLTSFAVLFLSSSAFGAASIVIQVADDPGVGFNDPTVVPAVGGNNATTLGRQRLNAFQYAANIWGAVLNSNTTITILARWQPMTCTTSTAVLGAAGTITIESDFSGAPVANTWYSAALANSKGGTDLNTGNADIRATFNSNLGNPDCLDGRPFYLGLDNNHGNNVDLVTVLLHEFAHGLGFQSFTNSGTGVRPQGINSIYDRFLFDNTAGKTWAAMTTDAERQASAINTGNLTWSGSQVTNDFVSMLGTPRLKVNSPPAIAGNYTVGTAAFGSPLATTGVTGIVAQAAPVDGCTSFPSGVFSGRIALIDRGNCNFTVKVKNAQVAGAVGVIIANNIPGIIQMSGGDSTISIPSVLVSDTDGFTIKNQLGTPVNATLMMDTSAPSGVALGRALMFSPDPISVGSSVSHWDVTEYPNQLMEPNISGDLTHSLAPTLDLTTSLLRDLGWSANPLGDNHFFVRQHYLDFLNREPDFAGFGFWTNIISSCGLDLGCTEVNRINVSASFFLSIEFQETGYLVHRFYRTAYGEADGNSTFGGPHPLKVPIVSRQEFLQNTQIIAQGVQVGIGNWKQQLADNKLAFATAFVQQGTFISKYPTSMSPTSFVDNLFATAGVLNPSPADRQVAINQFGSATDTTDTAARARAMLDIAQNSILHQQEKNKAFVLMQYFGYLKRNPNDPPELGLDHSGYEFWLTKLNQFNGDFISAEMVKAFINSIEYRQRFGS
ncbi:MAG: PA domain-containing protein [Pyrinomonadaceae bacterium]